MFSGPVVIPLDQVSSISTSAKETAELLANYIADKRIVPDADELTLETIQLTTKTLFFLITTQSVLKDL